MLLVPFMLLTGQKASYDYVVVMLPDESTHGEHKAASILALEAVAALVGPKPVVIGGSNPGPYYGLPGYPITSAPVNASFTFDRTQPIGNDTTYMVISSWSIAEHKVCFYQKMLLSFKQLTELIRAKDVWNSR